DPFHADSAPHDERTPRASDASLLPATKRILEMIAAGETLNGVLAALCAAMDVEVVRSLKSCERGGIELLHCAPYIRHWMASEGPGSGAGRDRRGETE